MKCINGLKWNDLTNEEKNMAEEQIVGIYKDWAVSGDEDDKKLYEILKHDKNERIAHLKNCKFSRFQYSNMSVVQVWIN